METTGGSTNPGVRKKKRGIQVCDLSRLMVDLITQVDHEVLIYLRFPLEAGGQQEHPVVNGCHGECSGGLDVQLLRWDKLAPLGVPLVDLRQ